MESLIGLIILGGAIWLIRAWIGGRPKSPPKFEPRPSYDQKPQPTRRPTPAPRLDMGETIIGPAYVVDGDTIVVNKVSIRLFGIDAPEMEHPFGIQAKWAMMDLCKGKQITVHVTDSDHYGRTVANCYLPDGRDLSAEMVKKRPRRGLAKVFGRHLQPV